MAAPPAHQFFNPFPPGQSLGTPSGDSDENGKCPIVPEVTDTLQITGQGTVAISSDAKKHLTISIKTEKKEDPTLRLEITASDILFYYEDAAGEKHNIEYELSPKKDKKSCALKPGIKTTYWLSVDHINGILRYGKHFYAKAMTLFETRLKEKDEEKGLWHWKDPSKFSWLDRLKEVEVIQDGNHRLEPLVHPLAVTRDIPPFVKPADKISLQELASYAFTAPVNLPEACQELYGNVAGIDISLSDDEFDKLGEAIEWSCTHEEGWAYQKLLQKAKDGELGHDIEGTYLRITLGENMGDSPGIPYVLEIWPSKHHSPIHDHGSSCAVIKVLHGNINCTWYDSLDDPTEISSTNLKHGNITWIGDNNYQIHKLHNDTPGVCVTIQCYRYPKTDQQHYGAFNWIDENNKLQPPFDPNSDKDFIQFRQIMLDEWKKYGPKKGS